MADVDITALGADIKTAYTGEVPQVSGAEITAGTETNLRSYSPKDVADVAAAHGVRTKLGTATVAGAAATSMTVSGLDLSAYTAFRIVGTLKEAAGGAANISLYYNADTTATNYYRALLTAAASVSGAVANDGLACVLQSNVMTDFSGTITPSVDGKVRATIESAEDSSATGMRFRSVAHRWNTVANVTSITLSSSVASSLDIGSTFTVYGIA